MHGGGFSNTYSDSNVGAFSGFVTTLKCVIQEKNGAYKIILLFNVECCI